MRVQFRFVALQPIYVQTGSKMLPLILLFFSLSFFGKAADVRVYTFDSQGNPIAGQFTVYDGPSLVGVYNSGDTADLTVGHTYKIWAQYDQTSTMRIMHTVSAPGDSLAFSTTNVKFHFSGGYLNFRGSGSWKSFGKDTITNEWNDRELFAFDFYGDTMRIQTGYVWNDTRNIEFDIYYKGQSSVEKTLAVLQVLDSKGDPIAGTTARGGYATPTTWFVPGSTNSDGLLLDCRDGKQTNLSYEAKVNNTVAVEGPKDPTTDSYYLFQTDSLVLKLQTCQALGLAGGVVRYGTGANYSSWFSPGNPTDGNGKILQEIFPGTYSFEMQYQGTADQKISEVIPAGGATLVWNTVHVQLNHDNNISYGGVNGDARFFNKPAMELLPGTYKFHFRNGNRQDLTLSGCYFTKSIVIVNVLDCNGNNQPDVGVKWYKYGDAGNMIDADSTGSGPYAVCIDSGITKIGVVVNYLGQSNTLVQHLVNESDTFTFQMMDVMLNLYNHDSTSALTPQDIKFYVYGQAGNVMQFPASQNKCLLPGTYGFIVKYNHTSQNRNGIDVSTTNPVIFQTGLVDDLDACTFNPTTYYAYGSAGTTFPFVDPMEFMPSKVGVHSSTNSTKLIQVQSAGVHRLDSCANVEVMDSCVSDTTWLKSTESQTSGSGHWYGVNSLPHDSTYTDTIEVGMPNSWGGLTTLPGTLPILAENDIRFYRKHFGLTDTAGLELRFRMYMNDGTELYINGHLIAREGDMDPQNFKGVPHDLFFKDDNTYDNGYLGGDSFDHVVSLHLDTILRKDMNTLVVVIRNPKRANQTGGFSLRMDVTKNGQSVLVKKKGAEDPAGRLLTVYPNPVLDILRVELLDDAPSAGQELSVYNLSGQLMHHEVVETSESVYRLNLSELDRGMYVLRLISGNKMRCAKIFKD